MMKLKNSTQWPDYFLRRLVSWCCRQVGFPPSRVRLAEFRNRPRGTYRGLATSSLRILVSIGPAARFPTEPDTDQGMDNESYADQMEALIAVTAHEIAHLLQYYQDRNQVLCAMRRAERDARWNEVKALRAFRQQRETLLAAWIKAPLRTRKKSSGAAYASQRPDERLAGPCEA